jgi:hypothetical protein
MDIDYSKGFKSFDETYEYLILPYVRECCLNCYKPGSIAFDDLETVYSRSDFCKCARGGC